jgi:hypothetical protein
MSDQAKQSFLHSFREALRFLEQGGGFTVEIEDYGLAVALSYRKDDLCIRFTYEVRDRMVDVEIVRCSEQERLPLGKRMGLYTILERIDTPATLDLYLERINQQLKVIHKQYRRLRRRLGHKDNLREWEVHREELSLQAEKYALIFRLVGNAVVEAARQALGLH